MGVEGLAETFEAGLLAITQAIADVASQVGLAKFTGEFRPVLHPVGHGVDTLLPGGSKTVGQCRGRRGLSDGPDGVNKGQAGPFLPRGSQIPNLMRVGAEGKSNGRIPDEQHVARHLFPAVIRQGAESRQ